VGLGWWLQPHPPPPQSDSRSCSADAHGASSLPGITLPEAPTPAHRWERGRRQGREVPSGDASREREGIVVVPSGVRYPSEPERHNHLWRK
jgi:hypothetical protein